MDHSRDRPTLKTIAELTGLSLSTVSSCLREGSAAKQSTRERVLEAAKQVGYVPNRAGVRLRTGRTNVLTLVLTTDQNILDYTRLLIQGIGDYLGDTRYHLNVTPELDPDDPVAAVRYILENRSSDGVILTHTSARDPRVQFLTDAGFPFVCHGRTEFYSPHAYHDFHAEAFIKLAVDRLVQRGRSRLLLAAVDNGTTNYSNTLNGFRQATADANIAGQLVNDPKALSVASDARELGQELVASDRKFDAIICNNELTALAIIGGLQDSGLRLGTDYDLICKQTTDILPTLFPKLDTVSESFFETGRELAKLLIGLIGGAATEDSQSLQEPITHWRSDTKAQDSALTA